MNSVNLYVSALRFTRLTSLAHLNTHPQIHVPVSTFLRSGRLHSSWLAPLSAATAAYLRLNNLTGTEAQLPASLWDVCKRCVQVRATRVI
jgi:hypothetical protein